MEDLDVALLAALELAARSEPPQLVTPPNMVELCRQAVKSNGGACRRSPAVVGAVHSAPEKQLPGKIERAAVCPPGPHKPSLQPIPKLEVRQVVSSLTAKATSPTVICLQWQPPTDTRAALRYRVWCVATGVETEVTAATSGTVTAVSTPFVGGPNHTLIYDGPELECYAKDLLPHTAYRFAVAALSTFQREAAEVAHAVCSTLDDLACPPRQVGAIMDGFVVCVPPACVPAPPLSKKHARIHCLPSLAKHMAAQIHGQTATATVLLQWQPPPSIPGVITGYTAMYRKGFGTGSAGASTVGEAEWREVMVVADTLSLSISGLQRFTAYEFTVAASTRAGRGKASNPVVVITGEDARRLFLAKEPRPLVHIPEKKPAVQQWAETAALQQARSVDGAIQDLAGDQQHLTVNYEVRGVSNSVGRTLRQLQRVSLQQGVAWNPDLHAGGEREAAQGRIDIYVTSSGVIRRTYEHCQVLMRIFQNLRYKTSIRDVYLSPKYSHELRDRLPDIKDPELPQVFIKGRHVGGVDEVQQLNERAQLAKLLDGVPRLDATAQCRRCGGQAFIPCWWCQGDKRSVNFRFTEHMEHNLRCTVCEASGLAPCPDCEE